MGGERHKRVDGIGPDEREQERRAAKRLADEMQRLAATDGLDEVGKGTLVDSIVGGAMVAPTEAAIERWRSTVPWQASKPLAIYQLRALRDVIGALGPRRGALQASTLLAAVPSIIGERPAPERTTTPGHAMWRATERRAATLYRQAADAGEAASDDPIIDEALARCGSGQPLPEALRKRMEAALGAPFGAVRVHTDDVAANAAAAVHARAFTVGDDIFFAGGAFAPGTPAGDKLLAHELAHVVQHHQGRTKNAGGVSAAGESLEQEADAMARRIERRMQPPVTRRHKAEAQRVSLPANGPAGTSAPSMRRAVGSAGAPLDEATRGTLEQALDADLSAVRVHSGPDAKAAAAGIDARAFTVGSDIYLGEGQADSELITHEVVHTLQPGTGSTALSDPSAPAEREAAGIARGASGGPALEARAAVIQRDSAGGGHVAQLRALLDDGDEDGAISLMGQLTGPEVTQVLGSAQLRELAVSTFDDEEMYRGVRAMRGNLVKSLEWLFAEGTEVGYTIDIINRCTVADQKTAVYNSAGLRGQFISLCGDDEMRQVCEALGGTLKQKLDWMMGEGTSWEVVRPLVVAAPEAQKAEVRTDRAMRSRFTDLLGDDEMRDLVTLLGGTLIDQLDWMFAEGTNWASLRQTIERQPDAGQRAAVRASSTMRTKFIDVVGDDEMEELVLLLAGDLKWKLDWMFGEGTNVEAVTRVIGWAPEAEKAAVRTDTALRGRFVSLCNDEEMAQVVDLLGGDLAFKVDWLIAEGTTWQKIKDLIAAAPEPEKAATRASTRARDRFVELLGDDEMKEAVQLLGGDLHFKLDWMMTEGTTWASIKPLIQAAPEAEKAPVRTAARMREHFIDLLGDDEMKEAVGLLGGDLRFKLDWMMGEGTNWASVKPLIQAAPETEKAAVRGDRAMRGRFIDLLGDDEMKEAVGLLGGDLRFKLDWMMGEGTNWESVKPLIQAAPETEKAAVRDDRAMRGRFVDLLGDDEMKEAVGILGGDLRFKIDWMLAEGTNWASVKTLIQAASETDKAGVRGDRTMRDRFVDLLGDDEMKEAVGLLGGDLHFKLDWMFAEGTNWASVKTLIQAAPEAEKAAIRTDRAMRERFIDLLGDDEMKEAVGLLGGDLQFKLDWMMGEGTNWASVKPLIRAAPEGEKAAVRTDRAMRDRFVDLLGDDEMKEAVGLLGGDLHFKLDWMFAEGTNWTSVKALIQGAPETEKAAVRTDRAMRDRFVELLGDDEMKEAVGVLGGDLHFKLDWMFAEGTSWSATKPLIQAAPEGDKAAVRVDRNMREHFIDLLGDDEMKEAVGILGGDLHFKLDWMFGEGTSWASVKPLIQAAPESEKAAVRADRTMRERFIDLLGDDEMKEAVGLLGGDLQFKLDWMMGEGTNWASVKTLIQGATDADKAAVRADRTMRDRFVDLLGDDEMKEAVGLLGGDLHFKLDWMMAEGTNWASVKPLIQAAPEGERAAVRSDAAMKTRFVDLLGDDEMKEAVGLLGGDLRFKLDWMFAEGTNWASVKTLIQAAPEAEKAIVRDDAAMKGRFVDLLGDEDMREAVQLLGGDLYFKLSWTLAEGTNWASVKALLQAADEPGKARVRDDLGMRGYFVDNFSNAEMSEAVGLLGGDLRFKLSWTLAEGTTWTAVRGLIEAAPATEKAAVLGDREIFDRLVELVGDDQMKQLLDLLGADLATRMRWMIAEGTDDAALRGVIGAASTEQQIALLQDSMLGQVLGILNGSAISAFPALTDPGRFATAMTVPLMVNELLEQPAQDVLTTLGSNPLAAAAALQHMDDAMRWMRPLPTRAGLSAEQRRLLRALFDATVRYTQRWTLFTKRFDVDLSGRWGSILDPTDLGRLWTIMDRLPDSHIENNSNIDDLIRHFRGGGTYGSGDINIGTRPGQTTTLYDNADWKTGPDMATFLGIPEADLAARVTSGQLETRMQAGVAQYRVKAFSVEYFDHTVLHEIGHAVDDMLGSHTDIVYGYAGWEELREGRVREWADQMGGWGAVQAGDNLEDVKSAICQVFDDYMDQSDDIPAPTTNIGAGLPADHPFVKYAAWPIVQRAGTKMFHYTGSHPYNDGTHLYTANFYYQKWYRVKSSAVAGIPRDYTRFAPAEWFADMYAEYYRQYDGTPATESLKGGNCPGPVKTWFDTHVDNYGRTPQATATGGRAPAHASGVSGSRR